MLIRMAVEVGPHRTPPHEPYPLWPWHGVRMSKEAYLALPEEKPYLEYLDGEAVQRPVSRSIRRRLHGRLVYDFAEYQMAHGGDSLMSVSVEMPVTGDVLIPEVAYWARRSREASLPVPAVVVLLSDDDRDYEHFRYKSRLWRRNGATCVWLIDPYAHTVEVFEGDRDAERLPADGVLETAVMPGFFVPLSELFAVLDR